MVYLKLAPLTAAFKPGCRIYHTFLGRGNWSPNYLIFMFTACSKLLRVFSYHHTMIQAEYINEIAILNYVSITYNTFC